jgi:hypothetical protein
MSYDAWRMTHYSMNYSAGGGGGNEIAPGVTASSGCGGIGNSRALNYIDKKVHPSTG